MIRIALVRDSDDPALARGEPPPGLLAPSEEAALAGLAFPARRRKWLLGRAAVKRALGEALGRAPASLAIANEPSGAPYASDAGGARLPWPISISHRAGVGLGAVALDPALRLGADLELVEPRDPALVRQFFDDDEIAEVARAAGRDRDLAVARIWSAKEAVLKLLGLGLRLDTRTIAVRAVGAAPAGPPFPPGFAPLAVVHAGAPVPCAVRDDGAWVIVLAATRVP